MASRHTILLVQPTRAASSRTFFDFPTVYEAMDGTFLCVRMLWSCPSFSYLESNLSNCMLRMYLSNVC
jgi:hypothetical protein